ncbi:MAG TPA: UvrD-helicase domain-containing protein [Solirubrobacteraceae bacterium]|nr:UvrD-helicase domain-containing protein [Solirubrobacteraceae bacterium]
MSTAIEQPPFDVCGPLPSGVTVLEASAGTGKTFTIAGLTARYVAEGVAPEELLVMTFTRNATAELRDRVRERLVSAEQGLDRVLTGEPVDASDGVLALLATGNEHEVRTRQRRLAAAVADFDAATIVTTHGFCQEVLGGLGIAGDLEPGIGFVEDVGDLVEQVVDDLYVRVFYDAEEVLFSRDQALKIAREAVRNPDAPLEPEPDETLPGRRRKLADAVRTELDQRKRRLGVLTYDDLLTRLDGALALDGGELIVERLRERYRVVLVDEFQDTDPTQWRIVRRAFGDGSTTLVLIGDPKQAIYAFRGADVYAYLDAKEAAGTQETLDVNWRSDQPLLDAYDALFGNAQLGHTGIVYRRVRAADANLVPRLDGPPLRIRIVDRGRVGTHNGMARVDPARDAIAEDLAADVVRLLNSRARIEERSVAPGDLAVLVRRNVDAELVRDALAEVEVPGVLAGAGSVFETPAARDWLALLEALERPSSTSRAHAAALTAFMGWTAERVAQATDDDWEQVHATLHRWAGVLRDRGVAALAQRATLTHEIPGRVLATDGGERTLTDLRHVGELLHAAAMQQRLGTSALTGWLRRRTKDAGRDLAEEARSRRLESDADAVQILTVHRSKGLEFPVVYAPFLWDPSWVSRRPEPVTYHDADDRDARKVDVALEGPGYQSHRRQSLVEQRGEDLRLMYVALTRARHRAVMWWAGTADSRHSPLSRIAFETAADGSVAVAGRRTPSDREAADRFAGMGLAVEWAARGLAVAWSPPLEPVERLDAARFDRTLDDEWRRTSYSDLTIRTHEPHVGSEPEDDVVDDEPADETAPAGAASLDDDALRGVPSLLSAMPGGTRVGTLVHDVLEAVDFASPDLDAELRVHVARAGVRRSVDAGDPETLIAGLQAVLRTPLGPLVDGLRLCDLPRGDRLDELVFELPLAGADRPCGEVTPGAIADVLARRLDARDPLAAYAQRLGDPALRHAVRGYLTGSVDLLLRTTVGGVPRFAIVDYKTNRLGGPDEELTAWHHRPAALAAEMQRMHYVLQALLYTVAVHRFLRWRLTGYDPAVNLAGVLYLFVRGMTGADTPVVDGVPCGVFSWRPPDGLVLELSDLFDRGVRA